MVDRGRSEKTDNPLIPVRTIDFHEAKPTKQEILFEEIKDVMDGKRDQKEFIETRLAELQEGVAPTEISLVSNKLYHGYIHPESKIVRNYMVDPFNLNDNEIYNIFIECLKELENRNGWEQTPFRTKAIHAAQTACVKYFGNAFATEGTEERNRGFYMSMLSAESGAFSIKEMKDKGFAVCAEKASLVQNLLSFAEVDSYLVASTKCKFSEDDQFGGHLYNIFTTEKGIYIFDPTNARLFIDKETKNALNYFPSPAVYPITEKQFEEIKNGGTVEVQHQDIIMCQDNTTELDEVAKRVYGM